MKVIPGHEKDFIEALTIGHQIARGVLGWRNHARLWVDMNLDRELFNRPKSNKRIRRKWMKRTLQLAIWQSVMEHVQ